MATPTGIASDPTATGPLSTDESAYRKRLSDAIRDRYRIEAVLGQGGMAIVYAAWDVKHNRRVAVKVLRPELAAALGPDRFHREIQIAARLQHPHVVPVYDSGEAEGLLYFVMQYVEGESLRERLHRDTQLPLETVVHIAHDVLTGLEYAHANGVIHRDIKPENILLVGETAVVADFGIARAVRVAGADRITEAGIVIGTPAYMSPEQIGGVDEVDARADVYSVGCVVHEMLVGQPPFLGPNKQAILARQLADTVPSIRAVRSTVPESMEAAVGKALAKAPADRFASAGEFAQALAAALTADTRSLPRWLSRAAVALIIGAGLWTAWHFLRPTPALDPSHVAVFPFQNETGDPTLDNLGGWIARAVHDGINSAEQIPVTMGPPIRTAGGDPNEAPGTDPIRAARELGAGTVILGAFYLIADSVQFRAEIVDVSDPTSRRAIQPVMGDRHDARKAAHLLRQRVMADLVALTTWSAARLDSLGLPETFEASALFARGRRFLFDRDYDDAIRLFFDAAAADTTFETPLLFAIMTYRVSGQFARADSLAQEVNRNRARLAPSDRHLLDIERARLRGDWGNVRILGRTRYESTLREPSHLIDVAVTALPAGYPGETVEAVRAMSLGGRKTYPASLRLITEGLHLMEEFGDELAEARRANAVYGNAELGVEHALRALAALGRPADIIAYIRRGVAPGSVLTDLGIELQTHHDSILAGQALMAAIEWYRGTVGTPAADAAGQIRALYAAGEHRQAADFLSQLSNGSLNQIDRAGYRGVLAARRGDRSAALAASARLAAMAAPYTFGEPSLWRARIAAVLGDAEQARALLQRAFHQGLAYDIRLHRDPDLFLLRDDPRFGQLLAPKG